jgi:hypothetical protein
VQSKRAWARRFSSVDQQIADGRGENHVLWAMRGVTRQVRGPFCSSRPQASLSSKGVQGRTHAIAAVLIAILTPVRACERGA